MSTLANERTTPHDSAAEAALLGAVIIENSLLEKVLDAEIVAADFWKPANRCVFEAMLELRSQNSPIDPVTLAAALERGGRIQDVGPAHIFRLTEGVPAGMNVTHYAGIVREKSIARRAIAIAETIKARAFDDDLAGAISALHAGTEQLYAPAGESFRVREQVDIERARREARRRVDAEERGAIVWPEILTLRERLQRPRPEKRWRIEGWQLEKTRVVIEAQFKAGKTTIRDNYIRSIVDGDPFLDRYPVTRFPGKVVVLDTELSGDMLDRWLDESRIQFQENVIPIPFRGKMGALNLVDAGVRAELVARIRDRVGAETITPILDNMRPVLDSLGLKENSEAGIFLVAFDQFLSDLGADEGMVIVHMGHGGDRARGDSRIVDWPDTSWRLVRQSEDPRSQRFLSAYGRDVDQPEQALDWQEFTRRLTVAGGSRHEARIDDALGRVLGVLAAAGEPMSGRAIKSELQGTGVPRDAIDAALAAGKGNGRLIRAPGPRNSTLWSLPVSGVSGSVRVSDPDTKRVSVLVSCKDTDTLAGHGEMK